MPHWRALGLTKQNHLPSLSKFPSSLDLFLLPKSGMVDMQRFSLVISFMQSTDSGNKGKNDKTEAWLEADPSKIATKSKQLFIYGR